MGLLGTKFKETLKATMPPEWLGSLAFLSHVVLEDAIDQTRLFRKMLNVHAKKH